MKNDCPSKMGNLSKYLLAGFEVANELYIAVAAGLIGMVVLIKHGFESHQSIKTVSVIGLSAISLAYIFQETAKINIDKKKVVFITGCDCGIGFSFAQHLVDLGFTVFAGFLSLDSKGSKEIKKKYGSDIIQIQLDITDNNSINSAVQALEHFLRKNPDFTLHAIVNNAGVMVFGEFEWLTERLISHQVNVNFLGTLKFTNAICPLIRQYQGRIVTVNSHCALANLPGLSVYGATKSALLSWSDGIRVELGKFGVSVTSLIPGSYATKSNIMGRQLNNVQEMHDNFTSEQHNFYSSYFKTYNMYLSCLAPPPDPVKIVDDMLYEKFECAVLDKHPKVIYKNEPFRYWIYHLLFKYSPWQIRDYLVVKFMQMPDYVPPKNQSLETDEDIDI